MLNNPNFIPNDVLRKAPCYPLAILMILCGSFMPTPEGIVIMVVVGLILYLVGRFGSRLNVLGLTIDSSGYSQRFVRD